MKWPLINFLDPAPPPQSKIKALSFFDGYLSDSDEEDDEDQGARKRIVEGFYGRKSRISRSSAAPIHGNSSSRYPSRLCAHKFKLLDHRLACRLYYRLACSIAESLSNLKLSL